MFQKETYWKEPEIPAIPVKMGPTGGSRPGKRKIGKFQGKLRAKETDRLRKKYWFVLRKGKAAVCKLEKELAGSCEKGTEDRRGATTCLEMNLSWLLFGVADQDCERITYFWCAIKVFHDFFHS